MRPRLTFANAISCLALFVALGGLAVAAGLPKSSVGTRQLKKDAVTNVKIKDGAVSAAKIRNGAVSGAKIADGSITGAQIADGSLTGTQVNASTLGTVPAAERANRATSASRADSLPPPETWHVVGAGGEPPFESGWKDFAPESSYETIAFYKDHESVVHLRGRAQNGGGSRMFTLPPGFRPAQGKTISEVGNCICSGESFGFIAVAGTSSSEPALSGGVLVPLAATEISLDGVIFRAES